MTTKPTFELDGVEAKLNSYTPRRQPHGDDPQPAASLAFAVNLDADALAMFALKVARAVNSPRHRDHWTDIVGYVALAERCGFVAEAAR